MKRTLLEAPPYGLPLSALNFIGDARIYDSSCSPEARVYFIDKEDGFYLKTAPLGTLKREAEMTQYFFKKGLGVEIISYEQAEFDMMISKRALGEDCTHAVYLSDPKRLCDKMAELLRTLHEMDHSDCPVKDRMTEYVSLAEANYESGNYDTSHFPDSFGYRSAEEAYLQFSSGKSLFKNEVLLHGDFCLPNIMLNGWEFSKFIDLGNGGVGDRHVDLFWGSWTLGFNLKTNEFNERFLDAYGRDKIDDEILKTVAAAEVFG